VIPPQTLEELSSPLTQWLCRRSGHDVAIVRMMRPAAGQSNDTVVCEILADGVPAALVVRRQKASGSLFRQPDVLREVRVLNGLASSRVPVPKVLWSEPDPAVLGAPFFAMERVEGVVPTGKPSIHTVGWLPTLTARERSRLWAAALDVLVAVHAVEWRLAHRFLATGESDGSSVAGHVARLTEWYRWAAQGRAFPITDVAAAYVEDHAASMAPTEEVLLWGDPRVGNMVFGDGLVPVAALDWETASIGPAERDVAHWLFFDEFGTDAVGIDRLPGWPDRGETIARYEKQSGRRLNDLAFFDVLQALFVATTLIRQADARVAGGLAPPGTRMGHDNTVTQMLARRLGLAVPELSPDYLAHRGHS